MEITPEHAEIRRLHKVCQHKDAVIIAAIKCIKELLELWIRTAVPNETIIRFYDLINDFRDETG